MRRRVRDGRSAGTGRRSPSGGFGPWSAAALATTLALAAVVAGCAAEDGTPGPSVADPGIRTGGLVVLSGESGAAQLSVLDDEGIWSDIALPDADAAWLSVSTGRRFLVTLADGRIMRSSVYRSSAAPTWAAVRASEPGEGPISGDLSFATWALDGGRLVALSADYVNGEAFRAVIIDPATSAGFVLPVSRRAEAAPPVWLDDTRLGLTTIAEDGSSALTIVDGATGDVTLDAFPGVQFAVSAASGSALAHLDAGRLVVEEDPTAWIERDASRAGPTEVPLGSREDGATPGVFALDPAGDRLAIVWLDRAGNAVAIRIHARSLGWREARRVAIPGDGRRAVVAWLP